MFDDFRLKEALVSYKRDFTQKLWPNEKYKWQAVKCFQVNWDVNATDFAGMLKKSLSATSNLLANVNNFPAKMIEKFAEIVPEETRAMFIELFDESKDVSERINNFKLKSSILLERYGNGAGQHYQNENSISTYLWLRYPDKYYIFKLNEVKVVAGELESDYRFKKGAYADNIRNFYAFYNEICTELQKDDELRNMLRAHVDGTCYNDPEMRTVTIDVGFYISRYYSQRNVVGLLSTETSDDSGIDIESLDSKEPIEAYGKEQFLQEVYMAEAKYDRLVSVLRNKKNIILQGAPGVGKTFAAKRLAWSIMGEKDENRVEFVQFHQNYSYEDFVMGYKPVEDGFELRYGIFYRFCQRAANQPDKDFFFIIDEINRGNMSKIFGELLMLIERDYRGAKATLAYNGLSFSVPKNLYLIGMMNTADRSLAMIDYALRRRFSFFEMEPGFDSDGFSRYQESLDNETLDKLVDRVKDLNKEISADKSLGKGFCIGHSYFCGRESCTDEWLDSIVNYDLLPMLSEYWFDDATRLQRWENILRGVLQ